MPGCSAAPPQSCSRCTRGRAPRSSSHPARVVQLAAILPRPAPHACRSWRTVPASAPSAPRPALLPICRAIPSLVRRDASATARSRRERTTEPAADRCSSPIRRVRWPPDHYHDDPSLNRTCFADLRRPFIAGLRRRGLATNRTTAACNCFPRLCKLPYLTNSDPPWPHIYTGRLILGCRH
jgi:hypothetical protein